VGITEKVHDAITGHTPATEGRKYGQPSVADMAKALKKFPRYELEGRVVKPVTELTTDPVNAAAK
jgi:hypothetical protein